MGVGNSEPQFDIKPIHPITKRAIAAANVYNLSKRHQGGQLISHLKFEMNAKDSAYRGHLMRLHESATFGVKDGLPSLYIVSYISNYSEINGLKLSS